MKYAGLLNNRVIIISPDLDTPPVYGPTPDGTPVTVAPIPEGSECTYNWIYDPETQTFSEPVYPDPEPAPEPEPTIEEQLAEVLLTETDILLNQQENDQAVAEMLLTETEIQLTQQAQDETLAEILLNQIGG